MSTGTGTPLKQPKQLVMLFFAEMWERFSYYGMRALLVLFMVTHFEWSETTAYHIYGTYGALVYATPFIGGVIADRILGYQKAVMLGGILMAIGHIVMAGPDFVPADSEIGKVFFYAALAFLIVGNGLFKPNISSIVGALYDEGDPRRDAGFTYFYMGVNLGAFLAPLICGTIGEFLGWSYGFGLAGIGMFAGLVVFGRGRPTLGDRGLPPTVSEESEELVIDQKKMGLSLGMWVNILSLVAVFLVSLLVQQYSIVTVGLPIFGGAVLLFILYVALSSKKKVERERLLVVLVLVFFSTLFWSFFELAGSAITIFTKRNVDTMGLPVTIFQSINPMFILIFGPVFSGLWVALAKRGRDIAAPLKFALGLFQLGLGFLVMVFGAMLAGESGMVGLVWLLLGYLLHTTGELCLSPVGLSMVTKLAPLRIVAMVLGAWYLSSSLAHQVSGIIAGYTSTDQYQEAAIQIEPRLGKTGDFTFQMKAYQLTEKGDTLYADGEVSVKVSIQESVEGKPKPYQIPNYTQYAQVKPGQSATINARVPYIDPLGDGMKIELEGDAQNGTAKLEGDNLVYTPNAGFTGNDQVTYNMCDENGGCEKIIVKLSVGTENTKPFILKESDEIFVQQNTTFNKSKEKINVSNYFADAEGDDIHIKILNEPSKKLCFVKESSTLNTFMTPSKTVLIYSRVFLYIFYFCLGATAFLVLLSPILTKWMHGIK